jgi:hypothetical protein
MAVQHHHKADETLIARSFKSVMQAVKKPPSRTTWLILIVALLVVVLAGSWFYFTSSATASSSSLWLDWMQKSESGSPAALEKVGQDSGQQSSLQARFAQAEAADRRMQDAVAQLGSVIERIAAVKEIETARDTYERLVRESGDNDALLEQSLMGAAKANETLGDVGKAKQFYQQLAQHSKSVLAREAEARANALKDENTKKEIESLAGEFAPPAPVK